jgi:hypothetical protein
MTAEPDGRPPIDEPASLQAESILRLFESPDRLLEAIVAAEVLALPLALRSGTTSSDRRTF